jgi:hypothetical protein
MFGFLMRLFFAQQVARKPKRRTQVRLARAAVKGAKIGWRVGKAR